MNGLFVTGYATGYWLYRPLAWGPIIAAK